MQAHSREEMAAADPYGGRGVFLPAPGESSGTILLRLGERMGAVVPAVAWDGIGAWVDQGSCGMSAAIICDRWSGGKASEHG